MEKIKQITFAGFTNEDVELLIDELGLIPSSFITPEVKKQILKELQMREFEMPDHEKFYHQQFLIKMRKLAELKRKRSKPEEKTLKLNF